MLGEFASQSVLARGPWHSRAAAHREGHSGAGGGGTFTAWRETPQAEEAVLWWHGPLGITPDLDLLWRSYVRRFDLEHTFRFFKQTLGWTTPRLRHPEQADRWSWLIVAAY